ncbi:MAG: 16S rRNA (guanine(966)-N(2))-methyltransferase RsmD, partial [Bacilli bacterium]
MKIISGKYKGRSLKGITLINTRPTMDRVKESLFAIINYYLDDSTVLDLFSGTGNLGIEALSNKSKTCYFVDNNKLAIKTIKENIKELNITEFTEVLLMDYHNALIFFKKKNIKFDVIFLDPPYKMDVVNDIIKDILKLEILNSKGIIVCEVDNNNNLKEFDSLDKIKEKKYADKYIVIYEMNCLNEEIK